MWKRLGVHPTPTSDTPQASQENGIANRLLPAKDPNESVVSRTKELLKPNGEDYAFGGTGGALTGIEKLHKATAGDQSITLQAKADQLTSTQSRLRGLADTAADPQLKANFLKQTDQAGRDLWRTNAGLRALNGPQELAKNISDPNQVAKQLGKIAPKLADSKLGGQLVGLGAGTTQKSAQLGGKVGNLGPAITEGGQRAGLNTAVAAGQAGADLEHLGPNGARLGQHVTEAGINAGNKAVALGNNLASRAAPLGQKLTAAGAAVGGRLTRLGTGETLAQAARTLAPKLATAGKLAVDVGKFGAKHAGMLGYGVNAAQAISDVAAGKAWQRAALETGGSVGGGLLGTAVGGAIGSVIPVAGTAVGAAVGNVVGSYVGGKIGDLTANWMGIKNDNK